MSAQASITPLATPREASAYIATMTADLAKLAARHGLTTQATLLTMAQMQAENDVIGKPTETI